MGFPPALIVSRDIETIDQNPFPFHTQPHQSSNNLYYVTVYIILCVCSSTTISDRFIQPPTLAKSIYYDATNSYKIYYHQHCSHSCVTDPILGSPDLILIFVFFIFPTHRIRSIVSRHIARCSIKAQHYTSPSSSKNRFNQLINNCRPLVGVH